MPKKKKNNRPKVHRELEGLDITVNEFGEIKTNYDINNINDFLNEKVEDKKLIEREDTLKKLEQKDKKSKKSRK